MASGDIELREFHEFPEEEHNLRYHRLWSAMDNAGVDAAVIADPRNCRYFTGCVSPSTHRPNIAIIPKHSGPVLLKARYQSPVVSAHTTWVSDMREYDPPISWSSVEEVLETLGLGSARVGVEFPDTFFGGFRPVLAGADQSSAAQCMPRAELVNISEEIWGLRIIKSDAEIDAMRRACAITSRAYDVMYSKACAGMTEEEVGALLVSAMASEGADLPSFGQSGPCAFLIIDSSRRPGEPHIPTAKPLRVGDVLHIDTGAVYKGYMADFAREAVVGPIGAYHQEMWSRVREKMDAALSCIEPGRPLGDICVHWHGIGLDFVEAPFIHRHDARPMEAGMTLAIEEILYGDGGDVFHIEENVVVVPGGYELLSTCSSVLRRI